MDASGWVTTMPLAYGQSALLDLVGSAGHLTVVLAP